MEARGEMELRETEEEIIEFAREAHRDYWSMLELRNRNRWFDWLMLPVFLIWLITVASCILLMSAGLALGVLRVFASMMGD